MISVLTIIIIFCLINYYIKKDLFTTTVLGLSLTFIYFMINSDFSLNILLYQKNLHIYFLFVICIVAFISFKNMNERLNNSFIKEKVQDIFDSILHDKKVKFLFLIVISYLMYTTPVASIILLIFLSTLLRISKYNLVVAPFVFISTFVVYNELILNVVTSKGFIILLVFLVVLYVELLVLLAIERFRKLGYKIKELLIDYVYYAILFIFNVVAMFVLYNVIELNEVIIVSLILTLALAMYLITRFDIFLNKEEKEEKNQDINKLEKLQQFKLPYLIMISFVFSYILAYIIFVNNTVFGMIFFILVNVIYSKLKQSEEDTVIDYAEYTKFIVIAFLSLVDLILLKEMLYVSSPIFGNIVDNYLLNHSNFISLIITVQNYIFFPLTNINIELINTLVDNNKIILKLLLSIKVQMIISFINIYLVYFIFKVKKEDILVVISILLGFSFILQLVVYVL